MSKTEVGKRKDMGMERFHQLSLGIIAASIMLFSSGCYGPTHHGHGSYSGSGSFNVVPIRPQPIPVAGNGSLGRRPGYTLVEFVPVQPSASHGRVGFYAKDQTMMDKNNPPELDHGGGGAGGGGAGGAGAGGGGGG
jgi:hypothetical protein